jgi:hypothetical protein
MHNPKPISNQHGTLSPRSHTNPLMGANAFLSTVKIDEDGHMVCVNGYKGLEEILKI